MAVPVEDTDAVADTIAEVYRLTEQQLQQLVTRYLSQGLAAPEWATSRLEQVNALHTAAAAIRDQLDQDTGGAFRRAAAAAYRSGAGSAVAELTAAGATGSTVLTATANAARVAAIALPQHGAIEALAAAVQRDVGARHSNILRDTVDAYRSVIATTVATGTLSGTQTRRQTAQAAWTQLQARGITGVTYADGTRHRLETYAEMAARTVTRRAVTAGQTDRLTQLGQRFVQVSNGGNVCPQCAPFQGRILRLDDGPTGSITVPGGPSGHPTQIRVVATLARARSAGFQHANCRHVLSVYLPGLTRDVAPDIVDPLAYAAKQKQRQLERTVRTVKEQRNGLLDPTPSEKRAAEAKVRAASANLRGHLADPGAYQRSAAAAKLGPEARAIERGSKDLARRTKGRTRTPAEQAQAQALTARAAAVRADLARIDSTPRLDPLKRLTAREAPGAGNRPHGGGIPDPGPLLPGPGGRPLLGPDRAPAAPPKRVRKAAPLAHLTDDDLDAKYLAALESGDEVAEVAADTEISRRVAATASAGRRAERDAARTAATRTARQDAQTATYEKAIAAGADDLTATARALGRTVVQQQRSEAIRNLGGDGTSETVFNRLSRQSWLGQAEQACMDAEEATNGYMLSKAGTIAGYPPDALFTASDAAVRKYASEELRGHFDKVGRPSLQEHRDGLLGNTRAVSDAQNRQEDYLR